MALGKSRNKSNLEFRLVFFFVKSNTEFSYRTQNRGTLESARVDRNIVERYLKTLTIPGSTDLYRKTVAHVFGHTIAPQGHIGQR